MRRVSELVFFSLCTAVLAWALIRWFPPRSETDAESAADQVATTYVGLVYDGDGDLDLFVVSLRAEPATKFVYDDDSDMDLFIAPLGGEPTGK